MKFYMHTHSSVIFCWKKEDRGAMASSNKKIDLKFDKTWLMLNYYEFFCRVSRNVI